MALGLVERGGRVVGFLAGLGVCLALTGPAHAQDWYDSNWQYRKKITIDSNEVTATLSNFPFMVSTTDADLKAQAQADGDDILFTDDNGTSKLDHEIEVWDSGTGNLVAWVRIPTLPDTVDKVIYLYYGNSGASDQQNAAGVWVNYAGVWHLNEASGARADSSGNNNHLTDENTVGSTTGRIGGGADFEASNSERLFITDGAQTGLDVPGNLTMQAWVKPESTSDTCSFIDKYAGSNKGYRIRINSSGPKYDTNVYNGSTGGTSANTAPSAGTWHLVVGVYNGSQVINYVNGAKENTDAYSGGAADSSEDFVIGARGSGQHYDGIVDEVRISTTDRSDQ
ncbi:MAG: DUF2341 domain-containing protein, partial [Planctomycetota bacterium]